MSRIRCAVRPSELNELMEFDHVIRVHSDGTVSEPGDIWAPELRDDELEEYGHSNGQPKGWRLMNGYSGQYGYSGPVMHDSEAIGGQMALDILEQPGLYVALVNYVSYPDDDCEHCRPECAGHESLAGADMGKTAFCDGSCNPNGERVVCDQHDTAGWVVAYIPEDEES